MCYGMTICLLDVVFGGFVLFPIGEKGIEMKSFLLNPMTYVVGGLFSLAMVFGGVELLADDPVGATNSVEFVPIVSFDNIFTTITSVIAPIIVGALGLGLAIWGTKYIFRIVKSMGR